MDPRAIEEFVGRDWQQAAAAKGAYWADRFRGEWRSTWDASQALLVHALRTRAPFASEPERATDLAAHVALRERLDRAGDARSPVVDLLADLAAALDELGVAWFLFGAQAAILHGAARLTADVDVTVRLPETMSNEALTEQLERFRFRSRFVDPEFTKRTSVIPFVHTPTSLPLDTVLAGPGLEERFFKRLELRDIDGVRVPLASPEDLVIMKVLAGRPKDLEDTTAILAAYGDRLDRRYMETTFAELEQALSQSDLVPAFRSAVAAAERWRR